LIVLNNIGEKDNLSQQNHDVVQELSHDLGEFLLQVDAQRPSFKATGDLCPWTGETPDS
jgi:L-lactate utilization protein LutB